MEQIRFSNYEIVFYLTLLNIILGFFFGTFPLIAGFLIKNRKYGVYGLISSLLGGAILGIFLAYPIAAIFTWLILRKPKPTETADSDIS